jgi:hypothetical protein
MLESVFAVAARISPLHGKRGRTDLRFLVRYMGTYTNNAILQLYHRRISSAGLELFEKVGID